MARINRAIAVSLDASWLGGTRRRLARPQKLRMDLYKVPQRFCHPLGKSRHDRSRKAVSDKDHIIQVFIPYDLHDIYDKRLPRGLAANRCERSPSPVRLGVYTKMSELPQARGNLFPAPAFEGATMNSTLGFWSDGPLRGELPTDMRDFMSAQRHKVPAKLVVSALQGLPAFCEQRGKDDPAVSWQGCEDRRVALLRWLPRFFFHRLSQFLTQPIKLACATSLSWRLTSLMRSMRDRM